MAGAYIKVEGIHIMEIEEEIKSVGQIKPIMVTAMDTMQTTPTMQITDNDTQRLCRLQQ